MCQGTEGGRGSGWRDLHFRLGQPICGGECPSEGTARAKALRQEPP